MISLVGQISPDGQQIITCSRMGSGKSHESLCEALTAPGKGVYPPAHMFIYPSHIKRLYVASRQSFGSEMKWGLSSFSCKTA